MIKPLSTTLLTPITFGATIRMPDLMDYIQNVDGRFKYRGNLEHYYNRLFFDSSNQEAGYHGWSHETHMTWETGDGGLWHIERDQMDELELRELGIGTIGHDAEHLPEKVISDRIEVQRGIDFTLAGLLPEDRPSESRIVKIQWATLFEFPRKRLENPSIAEKIIADADMTQALNTFWQQTVLWGLGRELKKTPFEMAEMQEGFLRSIEWYTEWAQIKFAPLVDQRIEHVHRLLHTLRKRN